MIHHGVNGNHVPELQIPLAPNTNGNPHSGCQMEAEGKMKLGFLPLPSRSEVLEQKV